MLIESVDDATLSAQIIARAAFHPYPTVAERAAWDGLPAPLRANLIAAGAALLGTPWPELSAVRYMEFRRDGDRVRYETPYFQRRKQLGTLVTAECVEGRGRFLDDCLNGIWAICEETSWVLPAHNGSGQALPDMHHPEIDLFAAETAALLAWTHYLLAPALDDAAPLVSARLHHEITTRIITPYLTRYFPWHGGNGGFVNNWNPWCNSNCLLAVLLEEEDPALRAKGMKLCLALLENFLGVYHPDGGCDEGPGYWAQAGGSLFDCLELVAQATAGRLDYFDRPLVREIGRFIARAHISGNYFINFADAPARLSPPADLICRYGERIGDGDLQALGRALATPAMEWVNFSRYLPRIFRWEARDARDETPPFPRDVWMPGIAVMAARERGGSDAGLYLAAKGGHNDESHNHNDIGQFIVYLDGRPILMDPGVGVYTRQTFSPQRYDLWTMQSAYHNLPTVRGVQQSPGRDFAARAVAYVADDAAAALTLDIAGAYPAEAGLRQWARTSRLLRGGNAAVEIIDDFALESPGEITLHLLTACTPEAVAPGEMRLREPTGLLATLHYPPTLRATIERIALADDKLTAVWGDHLYRINLAPDGPVPAARWVLRVTRE